MAVVELSDREADIIASALHDRYKELCEQHGSESEKSEINDLYSKIIKSQK